MTLVYDLAGRTEDREYRDFGVALTSPATDTDDMSYDADSKLIAGTKGRYANTIAFTYDDAGATATESMTLGGQTYTLTLGRDRAGAKTSRAPGWGCHQIWVLEPA